MNWNFVFSKLVEIFGSFFILYTTYNLSKHSIRVKRKDSLNRATKREKGWITIRTILIAIVLCEFVAYLKGTMDLEYFLIGLTLTIPSSLFGLADYFKKNDKLTVEERLKENIKINKEEIQAMENH